MNQDGFPPPPRFHPQPSPASPSQESGEGRPRRALAPADEPRGEKRAAVFARLPAFYRESPGLLAPLAGVAEDLIADLRRFLRREEERLARDPLRWRSSFEGGAGPPEARAAAAARGTAGAVAAWLATRFGAAPRIWAGLEARPHPAGGIEFRRAAGAAAVLAWEREVLPSPPEGFGIPEDLLPAGARVQAAIVKAAHGGSPRIGERVAGEVFWEWGGGGAAKGASP